MGVAVGDLDNDGDCDIYVTCVKQDRLLLNDGDFHFHDAAVSSGISESEWGTGVSLFDYDRDGFLDIVVANYTHDDTYDHQVSCGFRKGLTSYCGPHKFTPTIDRLYHNEGLHSESDDGSVRFSDVTDSSGMAEVTTYGFAVVTLDVNEDGWPDILIANDSQPNQRSRLFGGKHGDCGWGFRSRRTAGFHHLHFINREHHSFYADGTRIIC
jgi:hypothetical protein